LQDQKSSGLSAACSGKRRYLRYGGREAAAEEAGIAVAGGSG